MSQSSPVVLIVEDEWLIAELTRDYLLAAGFQVLQPIARLQDALNFVGANGFDAAILDVSLRGEATFPIARALADRGIPFVFMTGYVGDDFPADLKNRPVLNKPIDEDKLISSVHDLLH